MVHAVLYTKPKCVQCKMTKKKMEALGFPYVDNHEDNSIDITSSDKRKRNWSIQKIEKLKEKYKIGQLPFIKIVDDDNNVLDSWTGFLPGKITEWYGKIEES